MTKVSVYIVSRNYARYLRRAIESVMSQTLTDWELIIINDGSTDDTEEILKEFEADPRIRVFHQGPRGLPASCNTAIAMATGQYIVRLDADDYFDENALIVLSGILDSYPDVGLVYPDYYLISPDGGILELVRRKKINVDDRLLDLPAHGAGTMIRKECFQEVGGYDESVDCQDGYDLWLKLVDHFKIYNVNLPLFYYRKHPASLTANPERILRARRALKERHVEERYGSRTPPVLAIVPVRRVSPFGEGWALRPLGGKALLQYTLDEVNKCPLVSRAVVVTEDAATAAFARSHGVEVVVRPAHLARMNSPIEPTVQYTLAQLLQQGFAPEIVCLLYANSPLRKVDHISEAINTLLIFRPDSVISVCENTRLQYQHRLNGLEPIFRQRELRLEREALYEENGAIYVSWARAISEQSFLGKSVGHIIMTRESSVHLDTPYELWLAEQLVTVRGMPIAEGWDL